MRLEDISLVMMWRAQSFHATKISTNALYKVRILEGERDRILSKECLQLIVRGHECSGETPSSWSNKFVKIILDVAILIFLQNVGKIDYSKTIYDEGLSLANQVGFACCFLPPADLHLFLDISMKRCIEAGNLEGLLITGLDKCGIALLQSYVDIYSNVQTAALIIW
jgi:hypothetical protein